MLKTAFKNYIKNISYLLAIMGVIYLALIICIYIVGAKVLIPLRGYSLPVYEDVVEYFSGFAENLNMSVIFDSKFLRNMVTGLVPHLENLERKFLIEILLWLALALLTIIAANKLSQFVCRAIMRRKMSTAESLRGIFNTIFRVITSVVFWAIYIVVSYLWFFAAFLLPFVSMLVNSARDLFAAWFVHFKKIKFKKIFNFKSLMSLYGCNILFTIIHATFIVLLGYITTFSVALVIALPVLAYNSAVMDLTAAGYFLKRKADGKLHSEIAEISEAEKTEALTADTDISSEESKF